MGYVTGAFGVKGWIRLQPLTATPGNLAGYSAWWIGDEGRWRRCEVEQVQQHGATLAVKLAGCDDREAAARLRSRQVAVSRSQFPAAAENEYYWADLIGLAVVNEQGENLGRVARVFETGANDVLVVEGTQERLIPFIEDVVREVDLAGRVLRVDWGVDY